jgi:hypothetical protein
MCNSPVYTEDSYNDHMPDLMYKDHNLSEEEDDEFDTFGYTKPWDMHDHAQIQADSKIT